MSVTLERQDLETQPPVAPPRETIPTRREASLPWWWSLVLVMAIVGVITAGVLLTRDTTPEIVAGDGTPVVHSPGFVGAPGMDIELAATPVVFGPGFFGAPGLDLQPEARSVIYSPGFFGAPGLDISRPSVIHSPGFFGAPGLDLEAGG